MAISLEKSLNSNPAVLIYANHQWAYNKSYESTGGQPTTSNTTDFVSVAKACGYGFAVSVQTVDDFRMILENIENYESPRFIHIEISPGTIEVLNRPSNSPEEMKQTFMGFLK